MVDASQGDPVAKIREMTNGGVDYSFEAIGLKTDDGAGVRLPGHRRHGDADRHGAAGPEGRAGRAASLFGERKMQGSIMGSNRFRVDMPQYIEFYRQGRLKLDEMITRDGKLEDVNEAFRAMKAGEVARTVLMFN